MTRPFSSLSSLSLAGLLLAGACSRSSSSSAGASLPAPDWSVSAPSPDPRVGLRAGWFDAGQASWNLRLVSNTPPSEHFINRATPGVIDLLNSDLSFVGHYAIQGNFSGWQVWDIANPRRPTLRIAYVCPGSQSDVSVWRNLMFVSSEATSGRLDCGLQGVPDSVSHDRIRGIRIFDITDIGHPRYLANVQTCRGSHTHTVVTDPNDTANIYIYISGSAMVRPSSELAGCVSSPDDPNSALFRIEVIRVPLAAPEQAAIVSSPRIFNDLAPALRHAELPADVAAAAADEAAHPPTAATLAARAADRALSGRGPTQCHDITVYPAVGLGGGACRGYGLLLDIRDPAHPRRIAAVSDSNFSTWHSAMFNNDGTTVMFSDEWGGGLQPRCRATDKREWGGDAIFTIAGGQLTFQSYYKMMAPQTQYENCVSHNGTLIPVPGRDVMAQGWYQGGISVFDFTDPVHTKEIAFFDRGPMDSTRMVNGGSWSAYWYNGYIVSSDLSRGLDILELTPSPLLSQNEIDAAKLVHFDYLNAQDQPRFVWPASFVVARAYLDQLARSHGLTDDRIAALRTELAADARLSGARRHDALTQLAGRLSAESAGSTDQTKVRMLADEVRELADAPR